MGAIDPGRWGEFNAAQSGRPVRALARDALALAGPGDGRVAVELGSGAGIEAAFLADAGWVVHTVDADPAQAARLRELGETRPIHHRVAPLQTVEALPPCALLLSCVALPFVPRAHFPRLWQVVRAALEPGAVLAVDLFGVADDWAGGEGTFCTRAEVEGLLAGLEVVRLREIEEDARSFAGPKHWHRFSVLARAAGDMKEKASGVRVY